MIGFARARMFPTISAGVGVSSLRESTNSTVPRQASGASTGDFLFSCDLSYELDLWGRIRRSVTAAREEAQATAADLETARLSLQAELALDYFELRSADAQQRLLNDTVKAFKEALQLTINRFEGGAAPKSDVAQAQTQLETTQVQATDIAVQRAQFEHAIAILIGKPPAAFSLAAGAPGSPAAGYPGGSPVRAFGATPGHRGRRAPGRRGE